MKKKSLKQAIWSTLAIALVGCNGVTSNKVDNYAETQVYHSEKPIVEVETIDDTVYGRYSNQDFALEYNDNGLISLVTTKDKEVNIANFCAFAYEIYNKKLKQKLNNKEDLYPQDVELLAFCIAAQIDMINTLSITMQSAILGEDIVVPQSVINSIQVADFDADFKKQYNEIYKESINNFQNDGNITYKNIEKWGESFNVLPSDGLYRLFAELSEYNKTIIQQHIDGENKKITVNTGGGAVVGGSVGAVAGGLIAGPVGVGVGAVVGGVICGGISYSLSDLEYLFDDYKYTTTPAEISSLWRNINHGCTFYAKDLINIYKDLDGYISDSTSSSSRMLARDIHSDMYTEIESSIRGYYLVSADFPFTVYCCLAYSAIKGSKGVFNDDEEEMMVHMKTFNDYVSGVEMLKNLKTPYAASRYTELLAKAKDELSDNEFETLKTTIKLYQVNVSDEFYNDNTIDKL